MPHTWRPNVTVAAIIERDGQFLLVEEETSEGIRINQPAGHLEQDETLIDAVKREVLEETAWQFQPESLTGVYLRTDRASGITYLRFCFFGSCSNHDGQRSLDPDIIRTLWMDCDQMEAASDRMRSPLVIQCLRDYLSGQSYPIEMLHTITDSIHQ